METVDAVGIFQNLAYPVAVSVILFLAVFFIVKKMLAEMQLREEANTKLRDKYIEYLQKSNAELVSAINENSKAFNRFSQVLEKIERKLKAPDN
jgi:sensor domain CHASE-containing protein